jgi:hypothetical protein
MVNDTEWRQVGFISIGQLSYFVCILLQRNLYISTDERIRFLNRYEDRGKDE